MVAQRFRGRRLGRRRLVARQYQLSVGEYVSANESYLWLVDVASGQKTLLTPKGATEKVLYGGSVFSKDGRGL